VRSRIADDISTGERTANRPEVAGGGWNSRSGCCEVAVAASVE
jgi:hypothetical protein